MEQDNAISRKQDEELEYEELEEEEEESKDDEAQESVQDSVPERRKSLRETKKVSYSQFESEKLIGERTRRYEQQSKLGFAGKLQPKLVASGQHDREHPRSRDYDSEDNIDNANIELASDLGDQYPAVRHFFEVRLKNYITGLQNSDSTETFKNWKVVLLKRPGVLSAGLLELMYISVKGRKCRTRVEVAVALKLIEPPRPAKGTSRSCLYEASVELRERNIISQQLVAQGTECESIYYEGESLILKFLPRPNSSNPKAVALLDNYYGDKGRTEIEKSSNSSDLCVNSEEQEQTDHKENSKAYKTDYFAYGNTLVLDWGTIVPWPGFHNKRHIYPFGFKCIRQEHDVLLDKVVDVLCEVDVLPSEQEVTSIMSGMGYKLEEKIESTGDAFDSTASATAPGPPLLPTPTPKLLAGYSTSVRDIIARESIREIENSASRVKYLGTNGRLPLFRVTVAWELDDGTQAVRVYEAKSMPQVWQAAMIEKVGTNTQPLPTPFKSEQHDEVNGMEIDSNCDDEEKFIRISIRNLRRVYFKSLKIEQNLGLQEIITPRLSIDAIDSFVDEGLLRLIEGMPNVEKFCNSYIFVESRAREGVVRRNPMRSLASMHSKMKALEKILRRQMTITVLEEREKCKKERFESNEARKKARQDFKENREKRIAQLANKKQRVRDSERLVKLMKEAMFKESRRHRARAKAMIEGTNSSP